MWTQFMDMHSGGGQKLNWAYIYIEAPQDEAEIIFYNRFGRNPNRVTCTCCGEDYSTTESNDLAQATAYQRNCAYADGGYVERQDEGTRKYVPGAEDEAAWQAYLDTYPTSKYQTLEEYMKSEGVTFIPASHIKPEERRGSLPAEGYVWAGDD